MKILHVISTMNPTAGGPVEGINRLVNFYVENNVSSEILTLDDPLNSPWAIGSAVPIHMLGPAKYTYAYTSRLQPWLIENVNRFDAIIVNGLWQYTGFAIWRVCRKIGVPYFVFTHGMLDPWFKKKFPLKHLKKWLYWPWGQYPVLRDAKAVFFTCDEERLLAKESFWLYECNEVVVGYGTAAPKGDSLFQRRSFEAAFPAVTGKRVFLFLSRIHEKKGCDILIESFANFAIKDKSLHLVIAGPDQVGLKKSLVDLSQRLGIADRITWTGMLQGDLKWGAYHSADAFILPSHQENFGIVVAEALACGLPTLISNKVNIWREIVYDNAGLVSVDSVQGVDIMFRDWLLKSSDERDVFRGNARKCFAARFEMASAARNLISEIRRLI